MATSILSGMKMGGPQLCVQCGIRPVQGCRCNIGAEYCKICKDAHPGPRRTMDDYMAEYSGELAKEIMKKLENDVLDEFLRGPYESK